MPGRFAALPARPTPGGLRVKLELVEGSITSLTVFAARFRRGVPRMQQAVLTRPAMGGSGAWSLEVAAANDAAREV